MKIKLGEAQSLNSPDNLKFAPDDRQEKIATVGGCHVIDSGTIPSGETISFTAVFSPQNWSLIRSYWEGRTKVSFIDDQGNAHINRRVLVKAWSYKERFNYYEAEIELWAI